MLRIGLTGGIGAGKSTVSRQFADLGALVIDADVLARDVVAPHTPGLAAVVERFGPGVVDDDGCLDRSALAATVFGDDSARRDLEEMLHPRIAERTEEIIAAAGPDRIVVHDVPLLVEKSYGPALHLVVVVEAPVHVRLERLAKDRNMSENDARARMQHQASDGQRREAADILIDNGGDAEVTRAATTALWNERLRPFDENLRTGTIHRRPDTPVLIDYDPEWPHAAARIMERMSAALGAAAPEIEHVGSTAVPGMPGKNVIDIQIGVASLSVADDPSFVGALAALGFPRVDEYRMDHPTDDLPDPSLWVKRFHGSCDPGRIVHVHVREVASAGWQYALLFRDWLRANEDAVAEYVDVKARLAEEAASTCDYAEAKAPWFNDNWPRMQAWAQRTVWTD